MGINGGATPGCAKPTSAGEEGECIRVRKWTKCEREPTADFMEKRAVSPLILWESEEDHVGLPLGNEWFFSPKTGVRGDSRLRPGRSMPGIVLSLSLSGYSHRKRQFLIDVYAVWCQV